MSCFGGADNSFTADSICTVSASATRSLSWWKLAGLMRRPCRHDWRHCLLFVLFQARFAHSCSHCVASNSSFDCSHLHPCFRPRQVLTETESASRNVGTLGVALTTCTLPGQEPSSRLNADTIEVRGDERCSSEGGCPPPISVFRCPF